MKNDYWETEHGKLADNPDFMEKLEIIKSIIPDDVQTIVDVGCGDGIITNSLSKRHFVTGVDISDAALEHLYSRVKRVKASADNIPLPSLYADLVLSSELLEHLPSPVYEKAVSEFIRISNRYILITVPNDERLIKRYVKCSCGAEFHNYGHVRSINVTTLCQSFREYRVIFSKMCGVKEHRGFNLLYRIKHLLGVYAMPHKTTVCPRCGKHPSSKWSIYKSIVATLISYIELLTSKAKPYWLVVLLERR